MVGTGIWDVHINAGFISQRAEDRVLKVLYVAAEFVFVSGKELGVAGCWEMEYLSNQAGYTGLYALSSQRSSLKTLATKTQEIRQSVARLTRLAPALEPLMIILSGSTPSKFAFSLH